MANIQKITPNLWFDSKAEEAVKYYASIFKNSRVGRTTYYTKAGQEIHKKEPGTVLTIEFELEGQKFVALNAGPEFKFNEAVSFIITCKDQEEIDYYWSKLTQGGDPDSHQCGWLKDKFGLSWQVVPEVLTEMLMDEDRSKVENMMEVFMKMKKINLNELQLAFNKGEGARATY